MKTTLFILSLVGLFALPSQAAVLASYYTGAASNDPSFEANGVSAGGATPGNWMTAAGTTLNGNGVTFPGYSAYVTGITNQTNNSPELYLGFSITTSTSMTLSSLTLDWYSSNQSTGVVSPQAWGLMVFIYDKNDTFLAMTSSQVNPASIVAGGSASGTVTIDFTGLAGISDLDGYKLYIRRNSAPGIAVGSSAALALSNIKINGSVSEPIPEPTTATLSLLGLSALMFRRRR